MAYFRKHPIRKHDWFRPVIPKYDLDAVQRQPPAKSNHKKPNRQANKKWYFVREKIISAEEEKVSRNRSSKYDQYDQLQGVPEGMLTREVWPVHMVFVQLFVNVGFVCHIILISHALKLRYCTAHNIKSFPEMKNSIILKWSCIR